MSLELPSRTSRVVQVDPETGVLVSCLDFVDGVTVDSAEFARLLAGVSLNDIRGGAGA